METNFTKLLNALLGMEGGDHADYHAFFLLLMVHHQYEISVKGKLTQAHIFLL